MSTPTESVPEDEDTPIRAEAKGKYVTSEVQDDEFEGTAI